MPELPGGLASDLAAEAVAGMGGGVAFAVTVVHGDNASGGQGIGADGVRQSEECAVFDEFLEDGGFTAGINGSDGIDDDGCWDMTLAEAEHSSSHAVFGGDAVNDEGFARGGVTAEQGIGIGS